MGGSSEGQRTVSEKSAYIYDPIHGSIHLSGVMLELMGHPLLQRLWGIRQTGMAHLVFPGSSHTRLEHSLGTRWVTREMSAHLGLPSREATSLEIAALLHDLGHTPFSHSLEPALVESTGENHEDRTGRLIRGDLPRGMEAFGQDILEYRAPSIPEVLERHDVDPREVAKLLGQGFREKPYLRELLHGTIDADRLDYMLRDAHYTGVAHGVVDKSRIIATLGLHRNHVAFFEKGRAAVEGFLIGRSLMYSSVYFNKTVRVAETMLLSAVERHPEFLDRGGEILTATDGRLLTALDAAGGISRELARRLEARVLYKVAITSDKVSPTLTAHYRENPAERRAAEDAMAEELGGRGGNVLIDIPPVLELPGEDVRMLPDEGAEYRLLAKDPYLSRLVGRSPAPWELAVYTTPQYLAETQRRGFTWLRRHLRR